MRFYQATSFLFPKSFEFRVFTICFGAIHIPIIAFCALELVHGRWDWSVFLTLLAATIVGTGAAIAALSALLAPISHATSLLRSIQKGEPVPSVPIGGRDLVGTLLKEVELASAETRLRAQQLADSAMKDGLTGLRNRRGFLNDIKPVLDNGQNSVVAMVDLDHFKTINDRYGHDEGDRVLVAFGERLTAELRRSDIVARWGGDEFVILMPDTDLDEAADIIDRLGISMKNYPIVSNPSSSVTFSCGLSIVREQRSLEVAMRKADTALYVAKEGGRDRISKTT